MQYLLDFVLQFIFIDYLSLQIRLQGMDMHAALLRQVSQLSTQVSHFKGIPVTVVGDFGSLKLGSIRRTAPPCDFIQSN